MRSRQLIVGGAEPLTPRSSIGGIITHENVSHAAKLLLSYSEVWLQPQRRVLWYAECLRYDSTYLNQRRLGGYMADDAVHSIISGLRREVKVVQQKVSLRNLRVRVRSMPTSPVPGCFDSSLRTEHMRWYCNFCSPRAAKRMPALAKSSLCSRTHFTNWRRLQMMRTSSC